MDAAARMGPYDSDNDFDLTIDLHGQRLSRVPPNAVPAATRIAYLDTNQLEEIEGLSQCRALEQFLHKPLLALVLSVAIAQLSLHDNRLVRIAGLEACTNLRVLDLRNNSITRIEGLEFLAQLEYIDLSGNMLRSMSGLQQNARLEHVDLSNNRIMALANIASLRNLKTLHLQGNHIDTLNDVVAMLPRTITTLTVSRNSIRDLNQLSFLSFLAALETVAVAGNPCVREPRAFEYRPYVIFWCPTLRTIDNVSVTREERVTGQRVLQNAMFGPGKHNELVQFLSSQVPARQPPAESAARPAVFANDRPITGTGSSRYPPVTADAPPAERPSSSPPARGAVKRYADESSSYFPSHGGAPDDLPSTSDFVRVPQSTSPVHERPIPSVRGAPAVTRKANGTAYKGTPKQHEAATVIQAAWRGFHARTADPNVLRVYAEIRSRRLEDHVVALSAELHDVRVRVEQEAARARMMEDHVAQLHAELRELRKYIGRVEYERAAKAAQCIQKYWRGYLARKVWGNFRQDHAQQVDATLTIQRALRVKQSQDARQKTSSLIEHLASSLGGKTIDGGALVAVCVELSERLKKLEDRA